MRRDLRREALNAIPHEQDRQRPLRAIGQAPPEFSGQQSRGQSDLDVERPWYKGASFGGWGGAVLSAMERVHDAADQVPGSQVRVLQYLESLKTLHRIGLRTRCATCVT